jgi:hypothetical protein
MDNAQMTETKEQLKNVRADNALMTDYVKAMNIQQMFALEKLKTTLADAQLQREEYAQKCTTLEQKLNVLQLEYAELAEKHNACLVENGTVSSYNV